MKGSLRPRLPQLQQRIRRWIDELEVNDSFQGWMKERDVCFLDANAAFNWYLQPDGTIRVEDSDRYGHVLDLEDCLCAAVNALTQAARRRPELRELLPERPKEARECPLCVAPGTWS